MMNKDMIMMKKITASFGFLLLLSATLMGQAERKYIRQGNKEYKEEKFDESELLYRRALEKDRESYAGEFNLGDALYKQDKYEDAARNFERLAENEKDPVKLGYLYHNMGNSLLQAKKLEESIEAYKNALRHNPRDEETRHNLAYAQSLLQQQQQQQQQQQNQDKQNQDKQNQDKQNQDKQNQDKQDQEQQKQDQQDQDPQQQQISKEDAERMLQALQQDEQKLQGELQKQKARVQRVRVLKDW
jgi:Ca-activated chloride channel family protein